jgi:hypothetical protein
MIDHRSGARVGAAVLLGLAALASQSDAQGPPRASRSVYGKLETVDPSAGGIIMKTDDGRRVAWKFDKVVLDRLTEFKPGAPVVVIYRQRGADKAVTAIAFPGAAAAAVYHNTTGQRVELVGGPMVNGACGEPSDTPVSITSIPTGGQGEVAQACWCCAPAGGMCIPANRTGTGQAFLANCYE